MIVCIQIHNCHRIDVLVYELQRTQIDKETKRYFVASILFKKH